MFLSLSQVKTALYDTRKKFRNAGISAGGLHKDQRNLKKYRPNDDESRPWQERYDELCADGNFMHDGKVHDDASNHPFEDVVTDVSQGSIIRNFRQKMNKIIIHHSCFKGVTSYDSSSRSFVLGLKEALTKYHIPLHTFPFFNTIPNEAWALSNTSVSKADFLPCSHQLSLQVRR